MLILSLALKSLWFRRRIVGLLTTILALSLFLVMLLPHLEEGVKRGFSNAISGTSLIVGARGAPMNLALYSVFHMGDPTNNVSFETFQRWKKDARIEWVLPLSLGDSHRGFRVVGTTSDYFEKFTYGGRRALHFEQGQKFHNSLEVVIGAEVARSLQYGLGEKLVIAHGLIEIPGTAHEEHLFVVSGILAPTGTPIDRSLFVSLQDLDLLHDVKETESITSFLVRTKTPHQVLSLQRDLNEEINEPLTAVIPGVALNELWRLISYASVGLFVMGAISILVALLLLTTVFAIQVELRKDEFSILEKVGLGRGGLRSLILIEALISTGVALVLAQILVQGLKPVIAAVARSQLGLFVDFPGFVLMDLWVSLGTLGAAFLLGFIPAQRMIQGRLKDRAWRS